MGVRAGLGLARLVCARGIWGKRCFYLIFLGYIWACVLGGGYRSVEIQKSG